MIVPVLFLAALLCMPASVAFASAKAPKPAAGFDGSPAFAKLDLRSREAWRQAASSGETGTRLECFLKTTHPATKDDEALLRSAGYKVRTIAGTILTGDVAASELPAVAALDFVKAMELAVPVSIKKSE